MEAPVHLILVVAAFLLFLIASAGGWVAAPDWPWHRRLVALGLACWVLSTLVRV